MISLQFNWKKVLRNSILTIISLAIVTFVGYGAWYLYNYFGNTPMRVRVTNVSGRSATISWVSSKADVGIVTYAKDSEPTWLTSYKNSTAYDDRDYARALLEKANTITKGLSEKGDISKDNVVDARSLENIKVTQVGRYYVHHVTLTNLDPQSTYHFKVGNDLRAWGINGVKQTVTDNEPAALTAFSFKTYEDPANLKSPDPSYGRIYSMTKNSDGYITENPSTDALVFAQAVKSSNGVTSLLQSSLTNEDGGWTIDKANFRDEAGNPEFSLESGKDKLKVYYQFENILPIDWKEVAIGIGDVPVEPILGNTEDSVKVSSSNIGSVVGGLFSSILNTPTVKKFVPSVYAVSCKCSDGKDLGEKPEQRDCEIAKSTQCAPTSVDCKCLDGKSLGKKDSAAACNSARASQCGDSDKIDCSCDNGKSLGKKTPGECSGARRTQCDGKKGGGGGDGDEIKEGATRCEGKLAISCEPNKGCFCQNQVYKGGNWVPTNINGKPYGTVPGVLDCRPAACANFARKECVVDAKGNCIPRTDGSGSLCGGEDYDTPGCGDKKHCPLTYNELTKSCKPADTDEAICGPKPNEATVSSSGKNYICGHTCNKTAKKWDVNPISQCTAQGLGDTDIEICGTKPADKTETRSDGFTYICGNSCNRTVKKWVSHVGADCVIQGGDNVFRCPVDAQINGGKYVAGSSSCCKEGYICNSSGKASSCAPYYHNVAPTSGSLVCTPDASGTRSASCQEPTPILLIGSDGAKKCVSEDLYNGVKVCCNPGGADGWVYRGSCSAGIIDNAHCGRKTDGTELPTGQTICCKENSTGKLVTRWQCELGKETFVSDDPNKCLLTANCCNEGNGVYSWQGSGLCNGSIVTGADKNKCDTLNGGPSDPNQNVCAEREAGGERKVMTLSDLRSTSYYKITSISPAQCGYCCIDNGAYKSSSSKCSDRGYLEAKGKSYGSCSGVVQGVSTSNFNEPEEDSKGTVLAATDTNTFIKFYPEPGVYSLTVDDKKYIFPINAKTSAVMYIERNGKDGYQAPKKPDAPTDKEDLIINLTSKDINIQKVSEGYKLNLKKGLNLISFPTMLTTDGKKPLSAKDLMDAANINSVLVSQITYFSGGAWNPGLYVKSSDDNTKAGKDFPLVFGKGYLVKANFDTEITLPAYSIKDSIPVALTAGWNFVGVNGYAQNFTASSFIDSVNSIAALNSDNVTWWPTAKGKYEGLQKSQGIEYGFDFPIANNLGYFVRITKFTPSSPKVKSIIWNPGGDLNGKPGTN